MPPDAQMTAPIDTRRLVQFTREAHKELAKQENAVGRAEELGHQERQKGMKLVTFFCEKSLSLFSLEYTYQQEYYDKEQREKPMEERDERDAPAVSGCSFLGRQAVGGFPAHTKSKEEQGNQVGIDTTPPTPHARPSVGPPRPRACLACVRAGESGLLRGVDSGSGDEFFAEFDTRHAQLLARQATGADYFHLLVAEDGEVVGRVNLVEVADGSAELGYRIAQKVAGQGLATAAVRKVRELAATEYGLTRLRARVTLDNPASRKVLEHNGFVAGGSLTLNGKPAMSYICELG